MKIFKLTFLFFMLCLQIKAWSVTIFFDDFRDKIFTEKKYIICINKQDSSIWHWATRTLGSYEYARGKELLTPTEKEHLNTSVNAPLFLISNKFINVVVNACPAHYDTQVANSLNDLHQIVIMNENHIFYIFPGIQRVSYKPKKINIDPMAGLSIG
ncbi:hypothetical protein [Fluviispira multicolorata]|uniref:Uncharacterized protein n=1 Tax=Fluviispira multicolorata TaxID=2654512 RepID=A0A833N505_9BACT|nr:hypothetical protein [Fluviispira multicolorata]KAB8029702.1 hypothetical protein GCL57_09155 [Fluviispira multicolorata]